jgi:hypothetical protein
MKNNAKIAIGERFEQLKLENKIKMKTTISMTKKLREKRNGGIKWKAVEMEEKRKRVCLVFET